MATQASEAVLRVVEANRAKFDSATSSAGASQRRVAALELALAESRLEAREFARHLEHLQSSRSWRITRPLRWALAMMPAMERVPAPQAVHPGARPECDAPPSYDEWIRSEEPARRAAFAMPGPGHRATRPQRLGLVLVTGEAPRRVDGPDGCAVLHPDGCAVLHVEPSCAPPAIVARALDQLDVDLVAFLDGRDRLDPDALSLVGQVLAQYPHTDLLFADEDWLDATGHRERPFFKPCWSPELQLGCDLVGPFAFFRTAVLRQATVSTGPAWRYDLANQVAAATRPERIRHVPAVLCHRMALPPGHAEDMAAAAAAQLQRDGVAARIAPMPGGPGHQRVVYALPQPEPMVSIIVPTRDRADLLQVCAEGILGQTEYRRLEVLIVDNGTVAPDALALLERLAADDRVSVLRVPGAFNWSALNNAAAARAVGDVLVLLNNDIAVLQPDWLTVLVSHAMQPGVGAVGAKLLYPDGRVQHAGLTTDESGPRHLSRYAPGDSTGAFGMLALAREVWGVTGACLAIRRDVFAEVGGLNEALPVAFNDVDLCLRLTAHGYRLIWTPWSLVEHRELASRKPDHADGRLAEAQEELGRLQRDWGSFVLHDPFLNPNLRLRDDHPCLFRAS